MTCGACGETLAGSPFIGAIEDQDDDGRPQWLLLVNCAACESTRVIATVRVAPHRLTLGEVERRTAYAHVEDASVARGDAARAVAGGA